MVYGIDYRKRVLQHVKDGHSKKETCALFGISTNTLYLWEKQLEERGTLERKPRARSPRKLPLDELERYVSEHPDAYLREIAAFFDCSTTSVWYALRNLDITLKKDDNL